MKNYKVMLGVAAVSALFVFPAAGSAEEDAAAIWNSKCASCHGPDGKGQTKMGKILKVRDLTSPEVQAADDRDKMIASTTNGVLKADGKTPWMPGFGSKLSAEQIAAVVDYLRDDLAKKAPAENTE